MLLSIYRWNYRSVSFQAAKAIAPGVTADEIDRVVHEAAIERDCYPSPLGSVLFFVLCSVIFDHPMMRCLAFFGLWSLWVPKLVSSELCWCCEPEYSVIQYSESWCPIVLRPFSPSCNYHLPLTTHIFIHFKIKKNLSSYYKFPKSCCTSVNEVICHGIPDLRKLEDGDLCNGTYVSWLGFLYCWTYTIDSSSSAITFFWMLCMYHTWVAGLQVANSYF